MREEDKISENYRKKVDDLIWSQSNLNLPKPLLQEELDEIWEEIYVEMDIGEVWNDISSDLDIIMPEDSGSGLIIKSIAAVLIILLGMVPVTKPVIDSEISQPGIIIVKKQDAHTEESLIKNKPAGINTGVKVDRDNSPGLIRSLNRDEAAIGIYSEGRNKTGLPGETVNIPDNKDVVPDLSVNDAKDTNLALHTDPISKGQFIIHPVMVPYNTLKMTPLSSISNIDKPVIINYYSISGHSVQLSGPGRISIGLTALYKNTWLLNNKTFDGLKSQSLTTSEIVFFSDIGLSLNYGLNKKWQLQADGFFFSNTGQEYLEYYYGHYSRRAITLRYSTIALSVKYKFNGNSVLMPRSSVNVLAGGYFSVLNYANQRINSDLQNIGSHYQRYDLGVKLGSEIELHLFDNLSLAPGLSLSFGIPNIYKGTSNIPGNLRRTHNGSAELRLAFYYHFD